MMDMDLNRDWRLIVDRWTKDRGVPDEARYRLAATAQYQDAMRGFNQYGATEAQTFSALDVARKALK